MKYIFRRAKKSPLFWGGLVAFAFYSFLHNGVIQSAFLTRYLATHPVEYIETGLFFVGMTALILKLFDLFWERASIESAPILPDLQGTRLDSRSCKSLLRTINEFVDQRGNSYYPDRLGRAVKYVQQAESAELLDQELRYLAEEDSIRAESNYGFVQMIIWAIPILGFLGTVIGIALAMGQLAPEELERSLPVVMDGLTVAFDTTAIALAFSIVLYFSKFVVAQYETQILAQVDQQVNNELRSRFELVGPTNDNSQVIAVRRMVESLADGMQDLVDKQTTVFREHLGVLVALQDHLGSSVRQFQQSLIEISERNKGTALLENTKAVEQLIDSCFARMITSLAGSIQTTNIRSESVGNMETLGFQQKQKKAA